MLSMKQYVTHTLLRDCGFDGAFDKKRIPRAQWTADGARRDAALLETLDAWYRWTKAPLTKKNGPLSATQRLLTSLVGFAVTRDAKKRNWTYMHVGHSKFRLPGEEDDASRTFRPLLTSD